MLTKKCKYCGNEFETIHKKKQFCNNHCSAKFNNAHREFDPLNDKRTKKCKCVKCNKDIDVNIRADLSKCKCDECKHDEWLQKQLKIKTNRKILSSERKNVKTIIKTVAERNHESYIKNVKSKPKICKICGNDIHKQPCIRKDICKKQILFPGLIKHFGFDENKLGSIHAYEEYERIKSILIEDYYDKELSIRDISEKYNHKMCNIEKILKSFKIKLRSMSDSVALFIINKSSHKKNSYFKQGYYTTWDNKQVFYRSSYELDYCKQLDEQKIKYDVEKLKIPYWDTQLLKIRNAIPDFYLPETNEIVEIKGSHQFYNEQNMRDKFKAYKEYGFKVTYILNHVVINVEEYANSKQLVC